MICAPVFLPLSPSLSGYVRIIVIIAIVIAIIIIIIIVIIIIINNALIKVMMVTWIR